MIFLLSYKSVSARNPIAAIESQYGIGAVAVLHSLGFRFRAIAFLMRAVRAGFRGGKPSSSRLALTSSAWLNFKKVTMEGGNFPFSM